MSGEVFGWTRLIKHLPADRTIHGVNLPLADDGAPLFFDLESLAAHHVEQMLVHQPEGPYYVAGYSFGAMLALEIAQQLMSSGHHVALLGVLDTGPFRRDREGASRPPAFYYYTGNLYYWIVDDLLKTHPLRCSSAFVLS